MPKKNVNKGFLISLLLMACYLAVFLVTVFYKFRSAQYWLYTSDLYTYDTMLQETLKGFFGMEYTYGNLFGDHASLLLLFFLPVKWLLGKQMIYFLLLLTPSLYLLTGFLLLHYLKKAAVNLYFYVSAALLFAFHLYVYYGNFEGHYGYHIDTASGYVMLIMALAMILSNQHQIKNRFISFLLIISFICYVLIKEEMALLAIIFFVLAAIFEKRRKWMFFAGLSLLVFIIEILFIQYSKTSFNRGNVSIVSGLINTISENGIFYFFVTPDYNKFWLPLFSLILAYTLLTICNKLNGIALALFLTGLVKIAFSFSIGDFELYTWHSFPALVMLLGAILIQLTEKKKNTGRYYPEIISLLLFVFFIFRLFNWDVAYIKSTKGCINANFHYKNASISDLAEIKKLVTTNKVIALNGFLAFDFRDGYRYSFFPRGVDMLPCSIADYVLIDKEIQGKMPITSLILHPGDCVLNEFDTMAVNGSFVLYKRNFSKPMAFGNDRISFIRSYGKESIGVR